MKEMKKNIILLLTGILALAFNVQPVKASLGDVCDIYIVIDSDGTVWNTDKIYRDGDVYTFTDDIDCNGIMVLKDHIIIDGNAHTLQGSGVGDGFNLTDINNVTIKDVSIQNFRNGILLESGSPNSSFNNVIFENNITNNNNYGIVFSGSYDNKVFLNNITKNEYGVYFNVGISASSGNRFYHNNFIDNTTAPVGIADIYYGDCNNIWDSNDIWVDAYLCGGNYWSNYPGVDVNSGPERPEQNQPKKDGIGDEQHYVIDANDANNIDNFPSMNPYLLSVHNVETGLYYYTIQEAIDAASSGDTIHVSSEVCYQDETYPQPYYENVDLNKSVQLIGAGAGPPIIDGIRKRSINEEDHVVEITVNNIYVEVFPKIKIIADNTRVEGFTIQNAGSEKAGLYLDQSQFNYISNNRIVDNPGDGVSLYQSKHNRIVSNTIKNAGNANCALYLERSQFNNIISNSIVDNPGNAVRLYQSQHNRIISNTIKNTGDANCALYLDQSKFNHIGSNRIANNPNGLGLYNGSNYNTIVENYIGCNGNVGLDINDSDNILVSKNRISSNVSGIVIEDSNNTKVVDNGLGSNCGYAIHIKGNSRDSDIRGNTIAIEGDLNEDGSVDEADVNAFAGQWLAYHGSADLDCSNQVDFADFALLARNWYEVEDGNGIVVEVPSDANTTIASNLIISSDSAGIYLIETSNNTISDNVVRNGSCGLKLYNAPNNIIENNVVKSNSGDGVRITYHCSDCNIIGNQIFENGANGLLIDDSNDCNITGNEILDNATGLKIYNSDCNIISNVFKFNNLGIDLNSSGNVLWRNVLMENDVGINVNGQNNMIYRNVLANDMNGGTNATATRDWKNVWDNNYPYGGNFWSDYEGEDEKHGQDQNEETGDYPGGYTEYGIGDKKYYINVDPNDPNNVDNYPILLVSYKITKPHKPEMKRQYKLEVELTNDTNSLFPPSGMDVNFCGVEQTDAKPGRWLDWVPDRDLGVLITKWDLEIMDNLQSDTFPPVTIPPNEPNNTEDFTLRFTNDWNWIKPNDWSNVTKDLILAIPKVAKKAPPAVSIAFFILSCYDAARAVPSVKYIFKPKDSPLVIFTTDVTVKVPFYKQASLHSNLVLQAAALAFGIIAALLTAGIFTAWAAPPFWKMAAIFTVLSILAYYVAEDPDSNYTEIAEPNLISLPFEVNSLPEGIEKQLVLTGLEAASLTQAYKKSCARYDYARTADPCNEPNEYYKYYMALQLGAAQRYNAMATRKLQEFEYLSAILIADPNVNAAISGLTDADVDDFWADINANGLPQIQRDILEVFDFNDPAYDPNDPNRPCADDVCDVMLAATDPFEPNALRVRELWTEDPNSLYEYGHALVHAMVQAHHIQDYALQAEAEAENLTELIKVHYANDVAIINVWPFARQVSVGDEVIINVEVENYGACSVSFDVNTYAGTDAQPNLLSLGGTQTVNNLASREKRTLTFTWSTTGVNIGYYRIRAEADPLPGENFTADNNSTGGTIKVWFPYDISPPSAPNNLACTATHNTVFLTWDASLEADVAGYMVYRDDNLVGYAASTYYTDIGLLPGTEYRYYVKAYDVAGNPSGPSNEETVTTE